MFSKVIGTTVFGVEGVFISVEADVNDGLPMFTMVGYLSSSVKEAAERVRTALKNSGFHLPPKRVTINLSPADIKKDGSGFDLPIAIAVLLAMGMTPDINMENTVIIGELGLDGEVKAINGVLPMVSFCAINGIKRCIVPCDNVNEALLVKDIEIVGVNSLTQTIEYIQGIGNAEAKINNNNCISVVDDVYNTDFSEIKGQATLKRGLEIAAAGFHNVLMSGAAGAGKSMLAKRMPTILPHITFEESIDITKIYSISGLIDNSDALIKRRPFRAPHHTISNKALVGGGLNPKPGEISLAHNGVLFLDELPEFDKGVLEVLRQPLEDKKITIARVNGSCTFPADFLMLAAMNPCPCGYYPDMNKCNCSINQVRRYQSKISGPLLDRIDINMEVRPVKSSELFSESIEETSECIRNRVEAAKLIQFERYKDEKIKFNSQLEGKLLKKYIRLGDKEQRMIENIFVNKELSARGMNKILKVARTIADLAGAVNINTVHIQEAVFYRNGSMKGD